MSALSLHCAISVVLPTAQLPGYAGANRLAVPGGVVKGGQKLWLPGGNHQGVAKMGVINHAAHDIWGRQNCTPPWVPLTNATSLAVPVSHLSGRCHDGVFNVPR